MGRGGSFGGGSRGGGGSFGGGGRSGSFGGGRSRGSSFGGSRGGSRGGSIFGGSSSSGRSSGGSSGWSSGRSSSGSSGGGFGSGFLGGLAGGALSGGRGAKTTPAGGSYQRDVPSGPAGGGVPPMPPPAGTQTKKGCGKPLIIVAAIIAGIILLFAVWKIAGGGNSDIVRSTVAREALPAGSVTETGYYTDTIGVVEDRQQLEKGLKHFYEKTGVQPYLYLVDEVNGSTKPTSEQLEQFAQEQYDALFEDDEAHFLFVYFDNGDFYLNSYYIGDQAENIMDQEAIAILDGYFGRYYNDDDLSYDLIFSKVFEETADRMMEVSKPSWYPLVIMLAILGAGGIAAIGFFWWKHAKKQKNLEAEQTAAILNTPLETFDDAQTEQLEGKYGEQARPPDSAPTTFGDAEVEDLAKKYEDSQPKP